MTQEPLFNFIIEWLKNGGEEVKCFETQEERSFNLIEDYQQIQCNNMEVSGPIKVTEDGTIIENLIIVVDPTLESSKENDYALKIVAEDVTVRNVLIYHAANGMGLTATRAHRLTLENVEVIAYGNANGTQPCPSRHPFGGYNCTNINILRSEDVRISNTRTENGSKGIFLVDSPRSKLTNVIAINPRGPQPGGQCF